MDGCLAVADLAQQTGPGQLGSLPRVLNRKHVSDSGRVDELPDVASADAPPLGAVVLEGAELGAVEAVVADRRQRRGPRG